jgi:plastocyanin
MKRCATVSIFAVFVVVIAFALPAAAEDHIVNITYVEDASGIIHVDMDTPVITAGDTVTFNVTTGQPFSVQFKNNASPFSDGSLHFDNNQKKCAGCSGHGPYAYTL